MTNTDSIQAQLAALQVQNPGTTSAPSATMGKDDFLKLLVQQLQNQDPMNPMSGTDFAAQLAQFSSVEQLTNINTNLTQSLNANATLTSSINNALAATFIGKDVRAGASTFNFNGTDKVSLGFELTNSAASGTLEIYDSGGNLIRSMNVSGGSGDNTYQWDGKDDAGMAAPIGSYTFKVNLADSSGTAVSATPYVYGTVTGIRFKSDGTVFVIDGVEVALSNVLEILKD